MYEITDLCKYEEEIKKSRFHVIAKPVKSVDEAMSFFEENSIPSANHNCWAYKIGDDYRYNDDGEPSGTAGKPIFSAIEYANLTNLAVLVVRWFGGVKLGTGGLCRAYGGTAASCLKLTEKVEIIAKVSVSISVPFEFSNALYTMLENASFPKLSEVFEQTGLCICTEIPESDFEEFQQSVLNTTKGKAIFKVDKES